MAIPSLGLVLLLGIAAKAVGQDSIPGVDVRTDVVYGHKDGMALTYDVFTPKANAKGLGLLFMVSGGWVSAWAPPAQTAGIFRPMLENGYTVIAIRHGSSPRYLVPDAVADVQLALQHISDHAADYQIDPQKLGVFGFSAGGHLSLILGTQTNNRESLNGKTPPHVAAVAAVFAPTDLAPYVDPSSPQREQFPALRFDPKLSDSVSPIKHVTSDDAPTILIHGDKDDLVPISHSQDIKKVFDEKNVSNELMVVQGAGHQFNGQQQKEVYKAILGWFDAKLK